MRPLKVCFAQALSVSCFVAVGCAVTPAPSTEAARPAEVESAMLVSPSPTSIAVVPPLGPIMACNVPAPTCPAGTEFVKYLVQFKSLPPADDGKTYCPLVGRTDWYPANANCVTHVPAGTVATTSGGKVKIDPTGPLCSYEWHGDAAKLAASKNEICDLSFEQVFVVCTSPTQAGSCPVFPTINRGELVLNWGGMISGPSSKIVAGDPDSINQDMQGGCPNCVHVAP